MNIFYFNLFLKHDNILQAAHITIIFETQTNDKYRHPFPFNTLE